MTASDILGVSFPMRFDKSFWIFSISSVIDSYECDSLLFFASQVYNFFEFFSIRHLRLGSRFSPLRLHFPSFILWVSKLLILYYRRWGGMHFHFLCFRSWVCSLLNKNWRILIGLVVCLFLLFPCLAISIVVTSCNFKSSWICGLIPPM
jgi:hypothetical protein